jgi:hypothetical protein
MRTAIMLYLHKPHGKRQIPVYILNLYKPRCSPRKLCGTASSFHIRVRWRAACSADNGSASCFILNRNDYAGFGMAVTRWAQAATPHQQRNRDTNPQECA